MILSLKHRFIFIKGIKVAGTSIETHLSQVLEDDAIIAPLPSNVINHNDFPNHKARNYSSSNGEIWFNDHMPATAIRSVIGTWLYERLYKFGVIRNPFDKILSLYSMRRIDGKDITFKMAISEASSEKYLLCDGESMIVHRAILYENLNTELKDVFNQLDIPFEGFLKYKERSASRNTLKNEFIEISEEDIKQIIEKFSFEFNLYKKAGYPIVPPLPGRHRIGENIHFKS